MSESQSDNKRVRIRTADIPTAWLNARCRNLISKYALIAFKDDGTIFDLRHNNLLINLSKHSKRTQNTGLHAIYNEIKNELRKILAEPSRKTAVDILAEKVSFLESRSLG